MWEPVRNSRRKNPHESMRNLVGFWLLGLLNNASFVIMIAGAKNIDSGGVALIYLCATGPSFLIKLSAPYWFHLASYAFRVCLCGGFMASSFAVVSYGTHIASSTLQLFGVVFCSIQAGIGEASFLALASHYQTQAVVSMWSSGTGFAGVFGNVGSKVDNFAGTLTAKQRLVFTAKLWPYMAPLAIVYFAEYSMQSGAWTAVGFPVSSEASRKHFYYFANWSYQTGVLISRSSGMLLKLGLRELWAMSILQMALLVLFVLDAMHHIWYTWGLLFPCVVAGLLGGSVYANAFTLMGRELPLAEMELAMSTCSVADSIGILAANVCGLFIQSCLYKVNHISGARVSCPL
ncbi:hypothetical protein CYMTET_56844 [Cymbomonas tetramitiformis]|uniref:Battenin n=1 Tax=Cymbomonas tetramitiformis TaxID=36881 RepID=A0AAE0BBI0_9CHLO|nr:hypothetical protein CYMTET_56844 [Cymbomonas tetramitiformis]